jgi:hypothetical protein
VLDRWWAGEPDPTTLALLGSQGQGGLGAIDAERGD